MSDEPKRHASRSSKRPPRHDARAEPESVRPPPAEAPSSRGRRSDAPGSSRSGGANRTRPTTKIVRPAPPTQRVTQPELAPVRVRTVEPPVRAPEVDVGPAALRSKMSGLQQELAQAQQRLAKEREERAEDTDRMSDMLAQLTRAERSAQEGVARIEALTAGLEKARETSQWLRTAGEQTTRELATFQARERNDATVRASLDEEKAAREQAVAALGEAKAEHQATLEELSLARAEVGATEEMLARAKAELEGANGALTASRDATEAAESALRTAVLEHEKALRGLKEDHAGELTRRETERTEALAVATKDAEEQIRALAERVSGMTREMNALRVERDGFAEKLSQAQAAAARVALARDRVASLLSAAGGVVKQLGALDKDLADTPTKS
jgi:chromosome segregation ATPase